MIYFNSEETPLYLAAARGKFNTCQVLLELGADLNIADKNGIHIIHTSLVTSFNTNIK